MVKLTREKNLIIQSGPSGYLVASYENRFIGQENRLYLVTCQSHKFLLCFNKKLKMLFFQKRVPPQFDALPF